MSIARSAVMSLRKGVLNTALVFNAGLVISSVLLSVSPSANALDLVQVYDAAKIEDAQFNAARAAFDAGKASEGQGRAVLYPNVNLTAGLTKGSSDSTLASGVSTSSDFSNKSISLSLNQPLFRWQNWQAYQQGKTSSLVAEAQFSVAEQDLIVRVAQAYFNVLTAYNRLETLRTQEIAGKQQLESAKRNFAIGSATVIDTQQAQAALDQINAQVIAADADVEIKRAQLRVLTNKDDAKYAQLSARFEVSIPKEPMSDWINRARENNSAVVLQAYAQQLAEQNLSKVRANDYPSLDLVGSLTRQEGSTANSSSSNSSSNSSIGVQLTVPISAWVINRNVTTQAAANLRQAQYNLILAQRNAELSARQAYLNVTNGQNQVKALEAALLSSQSLLASTQRGYEVGVRINLDVLNAQQQLAQTQQNLTAARYSTLLATLQLKAAVGSLSVADLQQLNQSFK